MIAFKVGEKELLETVRPLWEQLNLWHTEHSKYFSNRFEAFDYDIRCKHFLVAEKIKVVLAYDGKVCIGYSVSTINAKGTGEIESLFLESIYRGQAIGEELMAIPLEWMADQTTRITLGVCVGNEEVYPFYERFGFYPKTTILERRTR